MDIQTTLKTLQLLLDDESRLSELSEQDRIKLMTVAGQISRPNRDALRSRHKAITKSLKNKKNTSDRNAGAQTGIRRAREAAVFSAPEKVQRPEHTESAKTLHSPRNCYVCKAEFTALHFFYDSMCPSCANYNYQKRHQTAPLHGQVALITGARLKIGYHIVLMLLRAGARYCHHSIPN